MKESIKNRAIIALITAAAAMPGLAGAHGTGEPGPHFVQIAVRTPVERTALAELGVSIESVKSDCIYGTATDKILDKVRHSQFRLMQTFKLNKEAQARILDFPNDDMRFHNYERMTQTLDAIVAAHPDIMTKSSIGQTVQGRQIWAVEINTSRLNRREDEASGKPGIVYMGNHHAREHLSAEVPLMLLKYLADNYGSNAEVTRLMQNRDIFIIPMVNPDGVEYDIEDGSYKWHRKNMRDNGDGNMGVDLNRNYGYGWGTGGSSDDTSSEVYMGPSAFSEPETQAVKAFVEGHPNLKVLLSYHTFSELILYPWGGKYAPVPDLRDHDTFKKMASKMATWNGYKPEQASELYIASGDTTDWAYGTQRIFAFTFELSPTSVFGGGFYPGAGVIDRVFANNLRPALYLLEMSDDPYRALSEEDARTSWLEY